MRQGVGGQEGGRRPALKKVTFFVFRPPLTRIFPAAPRRAHLAQSRPRCAAPGLPLHAAGAAHAPRARPHAAAAAAAAAILRGATCTPWCASRWVYMLLPPAFFLRARLRGLPPPSAPFARPSAHHPHAPAARRGGGAAPRAHHGVYPNPDISCTCVPWAAAKNSTLVRTSNTLLLQSHAGWRVEPPCLRHRPSRAAD